MLSITVDRSQARALEAAGVHLGKFAERLAEKAAMDGVAELMVRNRVRTGRSRMGWVAPIRRFGGTVPGLTARQATGRHGADMGHEGARLSRMRVRRRPSGMVISVENAVHYVRYLDQFDPFIKQGMRAVERRLRAEIRRDVAAFLASGGRSMP